MKNMMYLTVAALIVAACTKDGKLDDSDDKSRSEYYDLADGMAGSGGSGMANGNGDTTIQAGQITAGEWNDLENWYFWTNLGQKEDYTKMEQYWSYNLTNRISVVVKNGSGNVVGDQKVELLHKNDALIWQTRTDNKGMAELWPGNVSVTDLKVRIGTLILESPKIYSEGINQIVLNGAATAHLHKIDIAFVVDATGSMGDELEYLKVELVNVIDSVKEINNTSTLNLASVFYRDEGDDYVTRKSDFSTDVNKTASFIKQQSADGGGDFPEAVHSALNVAINDLQWSSSATSRVLFLLLDAPPHYEAQIVSQLHSLVVKANEKGIKIIPITASGIDKETEFLMRYLSIATNGTYVFITNHSGIGGDHLEPTVGEHQVELLNHLMVRLINRYLE